MSLFSASLVLLASVAAAAAAPPPPPIEQVIQAERDFAAETRDRGFKQGFLAFVAPDGFLFQPGPVPARPGLLALSDEPPPGPPLAWWPQFAGVANSGDLGFTSGPANIPVRYFTVWQKQPDGQWRWIYDGGPRLSAPLPGRPEDPILRLPAATAAAGSAEAALSEVRPLEERIAASSNRDALAARRIFLAPEALVAGSPAASLPGLSEAEAELARQPAQQQVSPLGSVASGAGDMVFAWGETRWESESRPRWGHYARIWQKRTEGWRIVADLTVPAPGAPPV